jgi:TonB family protein
MNPQDVNDAPPLAAASQGRIEGAARWLVQQAALSAPPSLAERLEEEWLADFEARRGPLSQLRFALGCCWATKIIARDFATSNVAATSAATGQKVMTVYAPSGFSFLSRRTTIFLFIVGLHVLLFYGLQNGLGRTVADIMPPSLDVGFIDEQQPRLQPPPPPSQPELARPKVDIPVPDFQVDAPPSTDTIQQIEPQPHDQPAAPPPPPKVVQRVPGGPGKGFPNTDDYYPPTSLRLREEGTAVVRVCVDEKGKLADEPALAGSSGHPRLDEGALKLAKAGSGRYRPTMEDGRPVSSCYPMRVKYQLR